MFSEDGVSFINLLVLNAIVSVESVDVLGEVFLLDQVFLLLSEDVHFLGGVFKPRVTQHFVSTQSLLWVYLQKLLY